jgi:excisionase family DNA binding protein
MKLIKLKDAAKLLSLSEKTLYQWRWQGRNFPFVKLGRALRVSEEELAKYVEERRTK